MKTLYTIIVIAAHAKRENHYAFSVYNSKFPRFPIHKTSITPLKYPKCLIAGGYYSCAKIAF